MQQHEHRLKRTSCHAQLSNQLRIAPQNFDFDGVDSWVVYFNARGFRPTDIGQATSFLSIPLTILFGIKKFEELGFSVPSGQRDDCHKRLRVDVVGAQVAEQAALSAGAFAEIARAFPASEVLLRLIGPDLDMDAVGEPHAPIGETNLHVSSHRMLYQDFRAHDGGPEPDIVVAPNAGVRESWYPAIQQICALNIPFMVTGYDLLDAVASLKPLFQDLPQPPCVVRDGQNPFAGFACGYQEATQSQLWAKAEAKEASVGEVVRRVQDPQMALLEAQRCLRDLRGDVKPHAGSAIMLNSHYFLIYGYG